MLYWMLYAAPVLASASPLRLNRFGRRFLGLLAGLLLVLIIGTRNEVGCDWASYLEHFRLTEGEEFAYALGTTDPGYALVNWLAAEAGLYIHTVNTVCAAIFATGLFLFCRRQPSPLLAAAIAIPYLVIVVAMGYTRQATAIGFLMLAFNAFADRRRWRFILLVVLAATFHRSAILFAPLAAFVPGLTTGRGLRPAHAAAVGVVAAASTALLAVFVGGHVESYAASYVLSEYRSTGDIYRIALNTAAALVFFVFRARWRSAFGDGRLYLVLSLASLATIPLVFLSSVGADRLSLYLIPLQIAAFSRLPFLLPRSLALPAKLAVVAGYAAVLFVWLQFGEHAFCWVPYDTSLL